MNTVIETIDTPDGPFTILVNDARQVIASGWTAEREAILLRLPSAARPRQVEEGESGAAEAVLEYYGGEVAAIDAVRVAHTGTEMQRAGWAALREITPGDPLTYSGFATLLGSPRAVRAAASICARNAPALFVPCHRVLRSDGSLGGFAWGLAVKESLLSRESAH